MRQYPNPEITIHLLSLVNSPAIHAIEQCWAVLQVNLSVMSNSLPNPSHIILTFQPDDEVENSPQVIQQADDSLAILPRESRQAGFVNCVL
jgi:hypothetical protein